MLSHSGGQWHFCLYAFGIMGNPLSTAYFYYSLEVFRAILTILALFPICSRYSSFFSLNLVRLLLPPLAWVPHRCFGEIQHFLAEIFWIFRPYGKIKLWFNFSKSSSDKWKWSMIGSWVKGSICRLSISLTNSGWFSARFVSVSWVLLLFSVTTSTTGSLA